MDRQTEAKAVNEKLKRIWDKQSMSDVQRAVANAFALGMMTENARNGENHERKK